MTKPPKKTAKRKKNPPSPLATPAAVDNKRQRPRETPDADDEIDGQKCYKCQAESDDVTSFICSAAGCKRRCCYLCSELGVAAPSDDVRAVLALASVHLLCAPNCDTDSLKPNQPSFQPDLEERLAPIEMQLKQIAAFLGTSGPSKDASKPAKSKGSYANAATNPTLSATVAHAHAAGAAQAREDFDKLRSVTLVGLELPDGADHAQLVHQVLDSLDIASTCRVDRIQRLPPPKPPAASGGSSATAPPPPKARLYMATRDMASALLASAPRLKDMERMKHVFVRPWRSREESKLIASRHRRREALISASTDPSISYTIAYGRPGFPVLKLVDGKPDWSFVDADQDQPAAHPAMDQGNASATPADQV